MTYLPLFKEDKPHFHTSGGQLAVGFRIYTYLSGTDTPVQVYSDPSGATPYTNPIVLDGRGEPSGQGIYADPSLSYKVVLKTPDDAVVWSMDGIKCGNSGDSVSYVRYIHRNSADYKFATINNLLNNGCDVIVTVYGMSGTGYYTLSRKSSSFIEFVLWKNGSYNVLTLYSNDTDALEQGNLGGEWETIRITSNSGIVTNYEWMEMRYNSSLKLYSLNFWCVISDISQLPLGWNDLFEVEIDKAPRILNFAVREERQNQDWVTENVVEQIGFDKTYDKVYLRLHNSGSYESGGQRLFYAPTIVFP